MMESFKVYLPSNASHLIYPDNKPGDYKTRLDTPMELDGNWEVAAESVFYSPNIDRTDEKAQVHCDVRALKRNYVVGKATNHFKLNSSIKWNGIIELIPVEFEKDPNNLKQVKQTLMDMSKELDQSNKYPAFMFTYDDFMKMTVLKDIYFILTPRLSQALGYKDKTIFGFIHREWATSNSKYRKPGEGNLTEKDYVVQVVNMSANERTTRLMIKPKGTAFSGGQDAFLSLWKAAIDREGNKIMKKNLRAYFSKSKKLIIDNFDPIIAIKFSSDLVKIVGHWRPIFGRSTTWSHYVAKLTKGHAAEAWYIDIFSLAPTYLHPLHEKVHQEFTVTVFPWRYNSIEEAMTYINTQVKKALEEKLKNGYDSKDHQFELTFSQRGHSKVTLGPKIRIDFSENLHHLFGITKIISEEKTEFHSARQLTHEMQREERLFLLTNIVKTTAYGQHDLPILQSFLHKPKSKYIVQKHFQPLVYLPLLHRTISVIDLKVTNTEYQPMKMNDYTTVVCLYFRKVSEKTMT